MRFVLCLAFLLQDDPSRSALGRLIDAGDTSVKDLPSTPVGRAVAVIGINLRTRAWTLEKEDVDIARRYLKTPEDKSFAFLCSEILRTKREGLRLPIARTLALAQLESIKRSNGTLPDMDVKAKFLGIVNDKENGWIAAEGVLVARVRSKEQAPEEIEKTAAGLEGAASFFTAAEMLLSAFRSQDRALAEGLARAAHAFALVPAPQKKAAEEIRTILERYKFCKNCGGTASRPCDYGPCEGGKVVKCCAVCNGTGKNPQSYSSPTQQTPCPGPGNNGKHKWVEDCPRCKGTGKMACRACKAPWKAPAPQDVFDATPCALCSGTGWALERVQLPCPQCFGVGSVLRAPKPAEPAK